MPYLSPQLADDLIMGSVRRRGGQVINDPSSIIAAHALQQRRDSAAVEEAGRSLGLQTARLNENQRQFDARLGLSRQRSEFNDRLARRQLKYARRAGDTASALGILGLGVSTLSGYAENKRAQQRLNEKNKLIKKLQSIGDADSIFYSNMLKYME